MFTGILKDEKAADYHARTDYISSSPLAHMKKSPLHFLDAWTKPNFEQTEAMARGNVIHSALLEQDLSRYCKRPLTESGRQVATNTKEYAAFLAANPGKEPISAELYDESLAILSAACENKTLMKAFEASSKEVSFYAQHEETGLYLKARPDMIADDYSFILDVKSTNDILKFERQLFELCYDTRLMHYIETIKAATGNVVPEVYFFAIESKRPYGSRMFKLDAEAVASASAQWNQWIRQIAVCKADNRWPGFADGIKSVSRPSYLNVADVSFDEVG